MQQQVEDDDEGSDSGGYSSPVEDESEIAEFFGGRCVFITGVSGFVGKVLLEKLLRSCSRIRTIFVLLRRKDGQEPRDRLDQLLQCQVFSRLPPGLLGRVVPVCGDISLPDLDLSQSDANMLAKHVSVVFHSAATVRFDETLKTSVDLNLLGTRRVLQLCKRMSKLAALVHVSTAYSFCNRREIKEVVYEEKVSPQRVIDIAQWMDSKMCEGILPSLLSGRPTTYHYSKALAEVLLKEEGEGLPIAIVRPSIVTAAYKEPAPGWVDGVNGPSTFIIMTGRGLLRTMLVYEGSVVDWMPVDLAANLLITAAWHIGTHSPDNIEVYNCTSGDLNRVTWHDVERTAHPLILKYPSINTIRYPGGTFKSRPLLNTLSIRLQHALPAHIVDALAPLFGHKTEFVPLVRRMERAMGFLQYFTTKEWRFRCENTCKLRDMQSPADQKVFSFDVRPVEWTPYLEQYVLGVRKFLLKEDPKTIPAARKRVQRLWWAERAAKAGLFFAISWLVVTRTDISNRLLWILIGLAFRVMRHMPKSWIKFINNMQ